MMQFGQSLSTLVEISDTLKPVYKMNLRTGDCLYVKTCNSMYTIRVIGDGWFEISGGWFDRKGKSPMRVRINGCTWGGSAIKLDIVAACGLCMEFGNRVVTSRIREVHVIRGGAWDRRGLRPVESPELFLSCYGSRWDTASAG